MTKGVALVWPVQDEGPLDEPAIDVLLDADFGRRRWHKLSYRLRTGLEPVSGLSLVVRRGSDLVGTIRYWPILLGRTPALLLGPLAVAMPLAGQGIGGSLIRHSLGLLAPTALVLLVGDLAYYGRFGFRPAPRLVSLPGEDPGRLLWLGPGGAGLPPAGGLLRRDECGMAGTLVQPVQQGRAGGHQVLVGEHR